MLNIYTGPSYSRKNCEMYRDTWKNSTSEVLGSENRGDLKDLWENMRGY